MIIVSCQPDSVFMHWQIEVQLLNFIDNGIDLKKYYPIFGYKNHVSKELLNLIVKYPEVNWRTYEDDRDRNSDFYPPSIKPYLLYKFFKNESIGSDIFLIDQDLLFTKGLDFLDDKLDDRKCYLSNTDEYTGSKYIKSKGLGIWDTICDIIGLNQYMASDVKTGGAQWLLKDVSDSKFWMKCYNDSNIIYKYLKNLESVNINNFDETNTPIQKWTAEMWSIFYNLLKTKKRDNIIIDDDMSFAWATDNISEVFKHNMYHNAGVTKDKSNTLFFKGQFLNGLNSDINTDNYDKNSATQFYLKYVKILLNKQKYERPI